MVDWKDAPTRSLNCSCRPRSRSSSTALSTGNIVHGISQALVLSTLAAGIAAMWNGVLSPALKAVHEKADQVMGKLLYSYPLSDKRSIGGTFYFVALLGSIQTFLIVFVSSVTPIWIDSNFVGMLYLLRMQKTKEHNALNHMN